MACVDRALFVRWTATKAGPSAATGGGCVIATQAMRLNAAVFAYGFPRFPPPASVRAVPELIWKMSNGSTQQSGGRQCEIQKR